MNTNSIKTTTTDHSHALMWLYLADSFLRAMTQEGVWAGMDRKKEAESRLKSMAMEDTFYLPCCCVWEQFCPEMCVSGNFTPWIWVLLLLLLLRTFRARWKVNEHSVNFAWTVNSTTWCKKAGSLPPPGSPDGKVLGTVIKHISAFLIQFVSWMPESHQTY